MAGAPPAKGTSVGLGLHDRVEQEAGGEEDRADAGMRLVELALIRLHIGDEFLEVVGRKLLLGGDDQRKRGHHADRLEIDIGLVGEIRIERDRGGMRAHLAHQDGVAVGIGAHRAGRADGAAGAGDVLDDDLLAQRVRHVIADDAGGDVGRASGRERHDQRDRARGIVLRARNERQYRQRGNARRQMQELSARFHDGSPLIYRRYLREFGATPA